MKKTISIKGMSCANCSARVEKALNALDGVKATVDLSAGKATVECGADISDSALREAVEALGFDCTGIE